MEDKDVLGKYIPKWNILVSSMDKASKVLRASIRDRDIEVENQKKKGAG